MYKSVRKIDGEHVVGLEVGGMLMCGKCSSPTAHMQAKTGGTIEEYCQKCHLSYVEEDSELVGK